MTETDESPPPSPTRRSRAAAPWIRLVLVLLVGLVACFPALLAVALLTFAGARFGWIPSVAAFAGLGFAIGWLAVTGRFRRARSVVAIGLAVLGGAIGITAASMAAPTHGRLRHEIDTIARPGWELERDDASGNAACFDQCNLVVRTYRVDDDLDAVRADLAPVIDERGCVVAFPAVDPDWWTCDQDRPTDITIRFELSGGSADGTIVEIWAEAS